MRIGQVIIEGGSLDGFGGILLLVSRDGVIVDANPAALECYGYSPDEMLGLRIRDIRSPDDQDAIEGQLQQAVDRGIWFEAEHRRKDGTVFPVMVQSISVTADGTPMLLSSIRDMSAALQADAERAEREERLQALFDNAPYGAHMYRLDGDRLVLTGWNRRAQQMLGIDHAPLLGMTLEEAFPGNVGTVTPDAYRRVAREGGTWEAGEYVYDAQGIAGVFEVYAFSFAPDHVSVFFRDITEKKRLEAAVRESEERYVRLFENMLEGFAYCRMIYDDDGRPVDWEYLEVNSAFGAITGLTDVIGRRVTEVLPTTMTDNPELLDVYARVASTGQPEEFEVDFKPTGMWLRVTALCPEPGHFVAIFEDISAHKSAEDEIRRLNVDLEDRIKVRTQQLASANDELVAVNAELSEANERLEEATRAKSEFLAAMSHELRTPLNSIIGFSSVLTQGLPGSLNPEQQRQVGMINNSGRHLLGLINEVLDLVKVEAGQTCADMGPTDVGPIVREMFDSVRPMAEAKSIKMLLDVADDLEPVTTDAHCVGQILLNLLGNAVKFTDEGHVSVTVATAGDDLAVAVEDTGCGIPVASLPYIFDDFFQATPHSAAAIEGTGLGLAVSQRLATSIGARLDVASEVGRGSTFTLRLPRSRV